MIAIKLIGAAKQIVCTFIALPINERYLFWIGRPTSEVYESLNRISFLSIVGLMLGLVLVFIILQISIVKMANSIISEVGNSRDTYMRYANYDALTGAYTRNYLDNWIKTLAKTKATVIHCWYDRRRLL